MQLSIKRHALQAFLIGSLLGGAVGACRQATMSRQAESRRDRAPEAGIHASLLATANTDLPDPLN